MSRGKVALPCCHHEGSVSVQSTWPRRERERGGFARLDLDGNDSTGAAINRLKNLRGGIPEIKDATKNQYAQQEYRYNGAACGALLHSFVSSILWPCASRYSWRITAAARASIS